jgi:hypothetical protein
MVCDTLEKTSKSGLVIFQEGGQHALLVLGRDLPDGLQRRFPFFRQVERVASSVAFMGTPFDQPLGFEPINERHQAAG